MEHYASYTAERVAALQTKVVRYSYPYIDLGSIYSPYCYVFTLDGDYEDERVLALRLLEKAHINYWQMSGRQHAVDLRLSQSYWTVCDKTDLLVRLLTEPGVKVQFNGGRTWTSIDDIRRECVFLILPDGKGNWWRRRQFRIIDERGQFAYASCTYRWIEEVPVRGFTASGGGGRAGENDF